MDEWLKELESDPEFARRKAEHEKELSERRARSIAAQKPLLDDLAAAGVKVDSVWDLVNTRSSYRSALPVLLDHLQKSYPDDVREGIARALAVRETRPIGWQILVKEFCETTYEHEGVKDGLAAALSGASDDTVLPELIALAKDMRNGSSRLLMLLGLRRSRRPEAKEAIAELSNDPVLAKEIRSWNRRKRK